MSKLKFKECEDCEEWNGNRFHCADICMKPFEAMDEFDEYKTLEEQGLLLQLPCRVGDTVWCIDSFNLCGTLRNPPIIREIKFNHHHLDFVGKTVFLTKEEAEAALAEMG